MNNKTLYLWDLADTLFEEKWQPQKTGLKNYDAYITSLGFNLKAISPLDYELAYEFPFKRGMFKLGLMPGALEILQWSQHNAIFTTGNKEQIDWRTEVFLKNNLPDIRPYFETIYSTFDWGNINKKTTEMFFKILEKEFNKGHETVVYTDNSLENCEKFYRASNRFPPKSTRVYYLTTKHKNLKNSGNFLTVYSLNQILSAENALTLNISKNPLE